MVMGEDVGTLRRGLPRDRRAARPVRERSLRRHAARRGGHPRGGGRPRHGGLSARLRDAVRRLLLSLPRPAHLPRRPLPLAHRRHDGVPDHGADAVRRPRSRAGAARRLARGLLRPHARDQGGDPVDAGRRQGPARRGDPRRRPGRDPRAQAHLPDGARRGARGRARGAAREGADRAGRLRRDRRRLRRDGGRGRGGGRPGRRVGRGARPALVEAARRAGAARVCGADGPGRGRRGGTARRRVRAPRSPRSSPRRRSSTCAGRSSA